MKAEQLRKSILQLAIQGKLVPQDPNDEPASVLLERIRAEKQRLIKEGKIKKDKGDSIIFKGDDNCYYEKIGKEVKNIDEEIPFEIPDSWCWVRLPSIANFTLGKTPDRHTDKYWNNGVYPWFSIADMQDKKVITTSKEKISEIAFKEKFNSSLSPKETLLMSFKLTVGRTSILGVDAVHNEAIISIFPYADREYITRNYLMNILGLLVDYVDQTDAIKGSTLNSHKLQHMFVPLPSLEEQKRIVAEIEKYESLIAEYDNLEQQATKLDNEIYDKLKKSILQYAIQGKLVEQDPNDEPASELLKRIRAEKKAQLGKKHVESYIYKGDDNCYYEHINGKNVNITEEIPFDLPNGWAWSRLSEAVDVRDGTHDTPQYTFEGFPLITGKDFYNGYFDLSKTQYISKKDYDEIIKRSAVDIGDILFSMIGGNIGSMIKITENNYFPMAIKNVALFKQYLKQATLSNYLFYFLKSQVEKMKQNAKGGAQQFIPLNYLRAYLFPIPPLAEQRRIVDKIDEIFAKL